MVKLTTYFLFLKYLNIYGIILLYWKILCKNKEGCNMEIFIMIGVCVLDLFVAVALFTFFIDAIGNRLWRIIIYGICATLIINVLGILSIL